MRHLSESDLLDVAEGTQPEDGHPHLAWCEGCRAQLNDLRAMLSRAADVQVPEPSPLFWDQLSARVRESIANDGDRHRRLEGVSWRGWRFAVPAVAIAALMIAVLVSLRAPVPAIVDSVASAPAIDADQPDDVVADVDDPSLTLIAEMAGEIDWDAAAEAGLTTPAGAIERVLMEMSEDERLELQRILKQELAGQGA